MTFQFRHIALMPVIAVLAACGGGGGDYRPTGHAKGSADAAYAQCDYEANLAIANNKASADLNAAVGDSIVAGLTKSKLLKKCMTAKDFARS